MPDNYGYRPPQGNPFYNPLQPGPDWGAGIRDTLNQMWSYRKYQEQLDEDKRRWEAEHALDQKRAEAQAEQSRGMAEYYRGEGRQTVAQKEAIDVDATIEAMRATGIFPEEFLTKARGLPGQQLLGMLERATSKMFAPPKEPKVQPKPNAYEMKRGDISKALKEGRITQEQADAVLFGLQKTEPKKAAPSSVAPAKQANESFVRDFLKQFPEDVRLKTAREIVKNTGSPPSSTEGFRLDMPATYLVAQKHVSDGLDDGKSVELVKKYDSMFGYFQHEVLPNYKSFDDFMKRSPNAKNPNIDKIAIRDWFKIYAQ